jgi:lipopolysaccharide biosynthesis protein
MNVDVRLIAFYLPQFHPIPENDAWWGKGFTEWTNATRARPSFRGHYQPHLPADLGFYDLRVPETREEQARLARQYGIYGFCYHFYWFNGRRLLERPLEEVLKSGAPDFPFCICWANENWSRRWDGKSNDLLIEQTYSPEGDIAFMRDVTPYFRDRRYITVNGRPLLLVYRVRELPDAKATATRWRTCAAEAGLADPYLCAVQDGGAATDPHAIGFDAVVEFPPHGAGMSDVDLTNHSVSAEFAGRVMDYVVSAKSMLDKPWPAWNYYRGVMPGWDNTARVGNRCMAFVNNHPQNYARWLKTAVTATRARYHGDERMVFINAWNEWAEGCHLEPDQVFGHAYLEATKASLTT